jgi:hypothetical protein
MRIRLLECLWGRPHSAKELAEWASLLPDRLYYHLAQLEQARLIEIAEYCRLAGCKVERVYRPTPVEPPGDEASPLEFTEFLGAMLEATRADITAASIAKEAGFQVTSELSARMVSSATIDGPKTPPEAVHGTR